MALNLSKLFRGSYSSFSRHSALHKSIIPSTSLISIHPFSTNATTQYQHLLTETRDNNIGLITLNRPKALNALCIDLLDEIVSALEGFENNDDISAIIITGSGGTFP